MVRLFADLVTSGLKTIDEVPQRIRAQVQAYIDSHTPAE